MTRLLVLALLTGCGRIVAPVEPCRYDVHTLLAADSVTVLATVAFPVYDCEAAWH